MVNKSKAEYDMQYAKENLKRIPLNVQKEKYIEIQEAAAAAGEKVNGYIKKAIDAYPEITNSAIFTFHLDEDITFNNKMFPALEKLLLDNSEYLKGFTRQGGSDGEYVLVLRFKGTDKNSEVIKAYGDLLTSYGIKFNYSDNTIEE